MNWNKFDRNDSSTYPPDGGIYLVAYGENLAIMQFFKTRFRYSSIGSVVHVEYWMELPALPILSQELR
jgi:hypothetical protein